MSDRNSPRIVGSDDWTWTGRWGQRRGGFPTLGLFLIVLGAVLVAGEFFTWAAIGLAAFFFAIGVVLIVSGLRDRSDGLLFVGVFMAALALSNVLSAAIVMHGDGWGAGFVV